MKKQEGEGLASSVRDIYIYIHEMVSRLLVADIDLEHEPSQDHNSTSLR